MLFYPCTHTQTLTFTRKLSVVFAGALVPADDALDVLVLQVLPVLRVHALRTGRGALLQRQELLLLDRVPLPRHGRMLTDTADRAARVARRLHHHHHNTPIVCQQTI